MGSTRSLTPWFSTQVSPSCSCSSNSKPYWRPEHPPPCTKTRSIKLGLPSPRMRSPTLRAAASVKTRAVSAMPFIGYLELHELTLYLRAQAYFNDSVVDIALHLGIDPEHEPPGRVDVPFDRTIEHDVRHVDRPFDAAMLAHRQGGARGPSRTYVASDPAIQV